MTQSFSTDLSGDIFIGADDKMAIATGIDALLFACQNAVKARLGEMIYAVDKGVAYFETIWTNAVNVAQYEASARAAILAIPGVTGIQSFDIQVASNVLTYEAEILTIYGTGGING